MIDAVVARIYEFQIFHFRQADYSAFFRDAPKQDKVALLKKAAKVAKYEQRKILKLVENK
ncbi:MAG: hypothetical protein WAU02_01615 [Candidatus Saccharimonadales bacterium]